MRLIKKNLFSKIFTFILSIIFIIFSLYTITNIKTETNSSLKIMKTYASISISGFIFNLLPSIINKDNALIVKNSLEIIKTNDSINYITLNLKNNIILFFNKEGWEILENIDSAYEKYENEKHDKYEIIKAPFYKDEVYHYSYPINISTKNFGWIHLGFDISSYKKSLHDKYIDIIFISLLAFLITIITTYFFVKRLTKPIELLSSRTKEVIKNKFENIVFKENNYEELDTLGNNFNIMINSIKESRLKIMSTNNELEKKVAQRTTQLNLLNKNLDLRIKKEIEKNYLQEKILFEQTKMIQMSELIKNVSHHWRQPLSIISTVVSAINLNNELNNIKDDEFSKNYLIIMENINYLTKTIDIFSNYLQKDDHIINFELNSTIRDILLLNKNTMNELFVKIDFKASKNSIYIQSQKSNLMQAIMNIFNNSLEIFEERNIQKRLIEISIEKNDKFALITIADNAKGIEANIINKIFEPYFTKKHQTLGKGMGLYLTYNIIVNKLKGKIKVYNNKDGATFLIKLPL